MLTDVDKRSQRIISRGPLRTIVEVKDVAWRPQPGQEPIDMTTLYILYAGRRECYVKATFSKSVDKYKFSTGIINVKILRNFQTNKVYVDVGEQIGLYLKKTAQDISAKQ